MEGIKNQLDVYNGIKPWRWFRQRLTPLLPIRHGTILFSSEISTALLVQSLLIFQQEILNIPSSSNDFHMCNSTDPLLQTLWPLRNNMKPQYRCICMPWTSKFLERQRDRTSHFRRQKSKLHHQRKHRCLSTAPQRHTIFVSHYHLAYNMLQVHHKDNSFTCNTVYCENHNRNVKYNI